MRFVYRKECVKTTWVFRVGLAASLVLLAWLTSAMWIPSIGQGLVCKEDNGPADALLIENFDPDYLLFERAEAIYRAGLAKRVLVTTFTLPDGTESRVNDGVIDLMVRIATLERVELIPLRAIEPISLNAAQQIRDALKARNIRSIAVITSGFRSRRSLLVYQAVLPQAGIGVSCVPVFGQTTPESWGKSWHGIQTVTEQFVKLQYYRFYVLPIHGRRHPFSDRR